MDKHFVSIYNFLLGLLALVMVCVPNLSGLFIVLTLVFAIIGAARKQMKFQVSTINVLFLCLYLVYLIGCLYTNNSDLASKYLEYKLSFVLFPLIFSFIPTGGKISIKPAGVGLIIGTVIVAAIGVNNALYCRSVDGVGCFVSGSISNLHHPSYFMVYFIIGLSISVYGKIKEWNGFHLFWIIPYFLLALVFHFLSLSLAGVLFIMVLFSGAFIYYVYKKWGKLLVLGALILMPILAIMMLTYVPQIEGEWNNAKWYAKEYSKNPTAFVEGRAYPMSGSETRLVLWTVSGQIIKDYPLGVGTGNVDDILVSRLSKLNQKELAKQRLNPHNQYFQTAIEIGFIGLIVLLSILFYGLKVGYKHRNWLLIILVANLGFNMLFESMLQRQSGIVFYTFWICLLVAYQTSQKINHEVNKL